MTGIFGTLAVSRRLSPGALLGLTAVSMGILGLTAPNVLVQAQILAVFGVVALFSPIAVAAMVPNKQG